MVSIGTLRRFFVTGCMSLVVVSSNLSLSLDKIWCLGGLQSISVWKRCRRWQMDVFIVRDIFWQEMRLCVNLGICLGSFNYIYPGFFAWTQIFVPWQRHSTDVVCVWVILRPTNSLRGRHGMAFGLRTKERPKAARQQWLGILLRFACAVRNKMQWQDYTTLVR